MTGATMASIHIKMQKRSVDLDSDANTRSVSRTVKLAV